MKAINEVENLKFRIRENKVIVHDVIHASAIILRADNTFGFYLLIFIKILKSSMQTLRQKKNEF